jgi:hypothetical protein
MVKNICFLAMKEGTISYLVSKKSLLGMEDLPSEKIRSLILERNCYCLKIMRNLAKSAVSS